MNSDVVTLYRPVGEAEMELIRQSEHKAFPPRLSWQPIFYPVLNEEYATQIARDWNTGDAASGYVGYVTRFQVKSEYIARYDVQTVGASWHQEYWIPAEELDEFNSNIVGTIEVVAEYRRPEADEQMNDHSPEYSTTLDIQAESSPYPRQTPFLYFNISLFWFALSFLWAGMITIVVQHLVKQMAGDKKDLYLAWTLAAGALVSTIICLIAGTMSDRSRRRMGRRRPYMVVGTLLSVPAILWLARVDSIPLLMLDFCLIQLWVNFATSPYQAMIPDMVPKERQGTASAYMGVSSLMGQLGGLILCSQVITRPDGMWIITVTFSGLLVLTTAYTVFAVRERPAVDNVIPKAGLLGTLVDSFRVNPRAYPDFFRLIGSRFVINMGFYTATEFLYFYVSDTLCAPDPVRVLGQILIITTVAGLIGNIPAGLLSDRISKKRVVYVSTSVTGAAVLLFVLTGSIPVALGAAFVFGVGIGAFFAVDWAFACNLLPERDEAKYMGVWHVAFTVPQVIAPFFGGFVAYFINQQIGQGAGYRAVFVLGIVYLLVGTLMIRPIREKVLPKK